VTRAPCRGRQKEERARRKGGKEEKRREDAKEEKAQAAAAASRPLRGPPPHLRHLPGLHVPALARGAAVPVPRALGPLTCAVCHASTSQLWPVAPLCPYPVPLVPSPAPFATPPRPSFGPWRRCARTPCPWSPHLRRLPRLHVPALARGAAGTAAMRPMGVGAKVVLIVIPLACAGPPPSVFNRFPPIY
jgi:hypothetical protein